MKANIASTLALLALLLAGCLRPEAVREAGIPPAADFAALSVDGVTAADAQVKWTGNGTAGSGPNPRSNQGVVYCLLDRCPDPPTPCSAANCERRAVRVDVSPDWWQDHEGFLEFSIRWPTVQADWFQTRIEDASGNVLAVGRAGFMGPFALVARLDRPAPGPYTAVVVHVSGASSYEAVVQLESRDRAPAVHDLLPNLVTLPPTDLTLEDPFVEGPGYFAVIPGAVLAPARRALGAQGCATEEVAAQGARRCLRFSNAVGNIGEGALEIRLPVEEGARSMAGGQFQQRVYRSDGASTDRPGGGAEFHPMHAHWHNAAANRYTVYRYDETAGSRGALVNEGRKAGICFADIGLVDLGLSDTAPGRYSGIPCLNPAYSTDWYMGLSPNWYDNYYWPLVDQYVEISGAPDGTYQLCSITNQDRTLLESDYSDNEGCTVFRLKGNQVEVVSPEPFHRTPDGQG